MNKYLLYILLIVAGYIIGVKYPALASKVGISA